MEIVSALLFGVAMAAWILWGYRSATGANKEIIRILKGKAK